MDIRWTPLYQTCFFSEVRYIRHLKDENKYGEWMRKESRESQIEGQKGKNNQDEGIAYTLLYISILISYTVQYQKENNQIWVVN